MTEIDKYFQDNYNTLREELINKYNKCKDTIDEDLVDVFYHIKSRNIQLNSIKGFIYQFIYNRHYRFYQKKKYQTVSLDEMFEFDIEQENYDYEEAYDYEDKYNRLKDVVKSLPLDKKVLYDLYWIRGLSYRKIAELLTTQHSLVAIQINEIKSILWEQLQ